MAAPEGGPSSGTWELICSANDADLKRTGNPILFAACSGDFILTGSSRPMVQLWRLGDGEVAHHGTLKSGNAAPTCIECAQDRNQARSAGTCQVAVACQNGQILLFDLREQQRAAQVLPSTMAEAATVCFVGNSHRLACGGSSGKLCLWDLRRTQTVEMEISPFLDLNGASKAENGFPNQASEPLHPAVSPNSQVSTRISSLCASHDGRLVACGRDSGDDGARVKGEALRTALAEVTADVQAHMRHGAVRSLSFDWRSKFLLSGGGDDSNVCLMDAGHWSTQNRKPCVERFLAHRKRVTSLKVSPDMREQLAAWSSWDGMVKLWDYRTQRLLLSFGEHMPKAVTSLAFAPVDGRFFVTTGADAKLALFAKR
eukprot:Skav233827  [mRNA]  locus=scaffold100:104858:113439:+ [translate_table: standard]